MHGTRKTHVSWLKKRLLKKRANREKRKTCNEIDDIPHVLGDVSALIILMAG
jgi:hypothetical protein